MIYGSWDLFEGTEESHEKYQPGYAMSRSNFETNTSGGISSVREEN
jgi:hypothetical protein